MRFLPSVSVLSLSLSLSLVASAQAGDGASDLQAGGLRPPGSGEDTPPPPSTESDLERADREDAGRGLEFVGLDGEVGYQYLGLETFRSNGLVDAEVVQTSQSGLVVGAGVGVRILFLTLGPRFRYGFFADWDLWSLDGEIGLRIPRGKLEPHLLLGAGYTSVGKVEMEEVLAASDVRIRGFNVRLGAGLDVYLSNALSVGALLTGEALFLTRAAVDDLATPAPGTPDAQAVYRVDGSSAGLAVAATGVIGLHF